MIRTWLFPAVFLTGFVFFLQWARHSRFFTWMFRPMPVPFWCYFVPMMLSTAGLLPSQSPLYDFLSKYALPVCLAMLLIPVDLFSLISLGWMVTFVMVSAIAGIMLGAILSFTAFHSFLPAESWRAVGALSGSWIGGSANMLALRESLAVPDAVFAPVVVVDTFLAYGWMAVLIFLAGFQRYFDKAIDGKGSAPAISLERDSFSAPETNQRSVPLAMVVSFLVAGCSLVAAGRLPAIGSFVTKATWVILLVTTASLLISLTGLFRPAGKMLEKSGTTILYILLGSIGARASLSAILEAPLFLLMGCVWLLIHGSVLFVSARFLRAPLFIVASASQACVGGTISAPMVAAIYRPAAAPVGLLLAILGNVLGTYLGLVVAAICRWIQG